jgi:phosphoribosylamine-glycine ligase
MLAPIPEKKLYWVDVRREADRHFARRRTGYVGIVTGVGATIEESRQEAIGLARSVIVPSLRWRDDIGAQGERNLTALRGFAVL